MNRKEIKEFLETLHFHGYVDHDITKLDNLIDDYYPKQCDKADVIKSVCNGKDIRCDNPSMDRNGNCRNCQGDMQTVL